MLIRYRFGKKIKSETSPKKYESVPKKCNMHSLALLNLCNLSPASFWKGVKMNHSLSGLCITSCLYISTSGIPLILKAMIWIISLHFLCHSSVLCTCYPFAYKHLKEPFSSCTYTRSTGQPHMYPYILWGRNVITHVVFFSDVKFVHFPFSSLKHGILFQFL